LAGKVSAQGISMNNHAIKKQTNVARRVLLHIDDDPDVAFLLERAFHTHRLTQWKLRHRSSGYEAMHYLQRAKNGELPAPALLALDIKMPGMGGLEVLEWATLSVPDVPAVILSSSDLPDDLRRARDLGSKGYFEKSATFCEFIDFLRNWETFQIRGSGAALAEGTLAA
jgi:CheY-like chemotaxis protein